MKKKWEKFSVLLSLFTLCELSKNFFFFNFFHLQVIWTRFSIHTCPHQKQTKQYLFDMQLSTVQDLSSMHGYMFVVGRLLVPMLPISPGFGVGIYAVAQCTAQERCKVICSLPVPTLNPLCTVLKGSIQGK